MRYPVVFWDSGGTIFHSSDRPEGFGGCPSPGDVRRQRTHRVTHALEMFGYPAPADLGHLIDASEKELRARDSAAYSVERLAQGLQERLSIVDRQEEALLLADALGGPRYRGWLWDGVAEALAALHIAGVRMGIIANTHLTARMMRNAITGAGLAGFFGPVICSCDVGVGKPDSRIFAAALDALHPAPAPDTRVLYVGDDPAKDIEGATTFGWDAALHLTASTAPGGIEVLAFSHYADLVDLVLGEDELRC